MTEPEKTYLVHVAGFPATIKRLTDGQVMLIGRDARMIQRSDIEGKLLFQITGRLMSVFEAAFVNPAEWEQVMDEMAAGRLGMEEVAAAVMSAFSSADDDEAPAKPVVRRGRPRKAQ